jgi:uroporphyrin-3 C-methyltransferase
MMPDNDHPPLPTAPVTPPPARSAWLSPWFLIALLALALAGWQWLETRQKLLDTQQEVVRRLAEADAANQEAHGVQKALREQVESLQAKLGAVDGKLDAFQGEAASLQALYQDLARSREEAMLLEAEQAITLAAQQLQLAGNVPVAVLALQNADQRLARLDRPQYLPLRKALASDLAKLNALPFVDVPGISLRLEQIILGIDKLPLAAYGRPLATPEKAEPAEVLPGWQIALAGVWQELKGLVRIQRFDREEPVLLAPGQAFFLRENIKLRLFNARLALLSRDQWTYRNELKVSQTWLASHFLGEDPSVQAAQNTLRQMVATDINVELPNLNDSQAALRALRNGKEKR